jgi:hypothetical protein
VTFRPSLSDAEGNNRTVEEIVTAYKAANQLRPSGAQPLFFRDGRGRAWVAGINENLRRTPNANPSPATLRLFRAELSFAAEFAAAHYGMSNSAFQANVRDAPPIAQVLR